MVYYNPLLASLPESFIFAWSDNQATEIVNAIAIIKMVLTLSSYFSSSSKTLFENLLLTLSFCLNCPTKSSLQVTTEFAQQVIKAFKSVNAKKEPPFPAKPFSLSYKDKLEEPKARALMLGFKKVNEVYIYPKHSLTLPLILYS